MTQEIVRQEQHAITRSEPMELTVDEIVNKVAKVREVAAQVMKEDVHFGTIPGTPKPTLYKAGGEILALTFRLAPKYEEQRIDLGKGHIEYKVKCDLYHIHTQEFYGSGIGSCSTMENKYRYRTGPVESTGRAVPKEYWDLRNSNPQSARDILGGSGFHVEKVDGVWEIVRQGEPIENPNPADQYNTVLKMAGKRAYVDAILKATAASEVYTQDLEDMDGNIIGAAKPVPKNTGVTPEEKKAVTEPIPEPTTGDDLGSPSNTGPGESQPAPSDKISGSQAKQLFAIANENGFKKAHQSIVLGSLGYKTTYDVDPEHFDILKQAFENGNPENADAIADYLKKM